MSRTIFIVVSMAVMLVLAIVIGRVFQEPVSQSPPEVSLADPGYLGRFPTVDTGPAIPDEEEQEKNNEPLPPVTSPDVVAESGTSTPSRSPGIFTVPVGPRAGSQTPPSRPVEPTPSTTPIPEVSAPIVSEPLQNDIPNNSSPTDALPDLPVPIIVPRPDSVSEEPLPSAEGVLEGIASPAMPPVESLPADPQPEEAATVAEGMAPLEEPEEPAVEPLSPIIAEPEITPVEVVAEPVSEPVAEVPPVTAQPAPPPQTTPQVETNNAPRTLVTTTSIPASRGRQVITKATLTMDGNTVVLRLEANSPVTAKYSTLPNPDRVILDLRGDWLVEPPRVTSNRMVSALRTGKPEGVTRLVFDMRVKQQQVDLRQVNDTTLEFRIR